MSQMQSELFTSSIQIDPVIVILKLYSNNSYFDLIFNIVTDFQKINDTTYFVNINKTLTLPFYNPDTKSNKINNINEKVDSKLNNLSSIAKIVVDNVKMLAILN
jgi:phage anti-repressor protein